MNSQSSIIRLSSIWVIGPESIKFHRCYAITLSDVAIKTNTLSSCNLHPAHIAYCRTVWTVSSGSTISCYFILLKKVNPYLLHKERLKLTESELISAGPGSDTSHLQDPHIAQFDCQTNNNGESRVSILTARLKGYKYLVASVLRVTDSIRAKGSEH